jgi:2-amino-4-hydroxy-6-hydroxymethyldihydropteridine diphosphokinase
VPRVYVSIGSNIEREKNIRGAASSVYETHAEGFDGDDFYNLAACFDTDEPVEDVRAALLAIEAAHGRVREHKHHGARTLDIDILLYGDLIRHQPPLDIPRREILQYAFVLAPLAELAPDLAHPETGERFAELWRRFDKKTEMRKVSL